MLAKDIFAYLRSLPPNVRLYRLYIGFEKNGNDFIMINQISDVAQFYCVGGLRTDLSLFVIAMSGATKHQYKAILDPTMCSLDDRTLNYG